MKLLLTIMMATVISGSAYAACDKAQDCKNEADCKALNKEGISFNFVNGICMVQETGKNDCLAINNQSLTKEGGPGTQGGGKDGGPTSSK